MSTIRFDSKRAPGAVVVFKDSHPVAIIAVNKIQDSVKIKFNDRFVIPLRDIPSSNFMEQISAIKPGTYQEVKAAVIEVLKELP